MSDSRLKESNIEWLGEIPKDWNLMPIKYGIKNSVSGDWGTDPLKKSNQKKCICLRVADFDFDKGIFKQNKYTIRAYSQEKINQLKLQSGDILIEKSGGGEKQPVGRAVLFDKDFSAMFANFLVRIRTNKLLVPSFLEYYLRALYYTGSTRLYFNQTTGIQNLKVGTLLSNEKIPNISIALQNNITNYLNKRCKKVDDIIAKVQQEITDLEAYRKSVITKTITKGLNPNVPMKDSGIEWIGKIPTDWSVIRLKYLGSAGNGLTYSPQNMTDESGTLILRSSNIQHGEIVNADNVYVNSSVSKSLILKKDDLLICSRNGSKDLIGKNALINKEFIGSSFGAFMCVFRSKYNQYIYYVLNSNIFKFYVGSFLTSTINQLTKHNLYNLAFPFPQKENERKQIIAFLKEKCENINHLITHKKDQLKLLNQYKQSIIYEYVTGKKQVPTEEGAKE